LPTDASSPSPGATGIVGIEPGNVFDRDMK
jgi:hypothetical protein